jgi:hypothetical protein
MKPNQKYAGTRIGQLPVLNAPITCEEHQKISAKAILPQLGY